MTKLFDEPFERGTRIAAPSTMESSLYRYRGMLDAGNHVIEAGDGRLFTFGDRELRSRWSAYTDIKEGQVYKYRGRGDGVLYTVHNVHKGVVTYHVIDDGGSYYNARTVEDFQERFVRTDG